MGYTLILVVLFVVSYYLMRRPKMAAEKCDDCKRMLEGTKKIGLLVDGVLIEEKRLCAACLSESREVFHAPSVRSMV